MDGDASRSLKSIQRQQRKLLTLKQLRSPRIALYGQSILNHDNNLIALDSHLVHAQPAFVGETSAGEQVELPAMPGTRQDLAFAAPDPFARGRGERGASQAPETDRREFVRADVQHGHVAAMYIEDADRPPLNLNNLPRAR
jgi:hypothetical protein